MVEGTAVRQPVVLPRHEEREEEKTVSRQTSRNRQRASAVNMGYVAFLTFMAVMTVIMCVFYVRLKSTITSQLEENAVLESQLTTLTNENDALYENITNSVDLDHIREVAMGKFGMTYPTEDQVITYHVDDTGYVRQYQDVPSGG